MEISDDERSDHERSHVEVGGVGEVGGGEVIDEGGNETSPGGGRRGLGARRLIVDPEIFPKNLILVIACHGEALLDKKASKAKGRMSPQIIDIPSSLNLYKINLAPINKLSAVSSCRAVHVDKAFMSHDTSHALENEMKKSDYSRIYGIINSALDSNGGKKHISNTIDRGELLNFMTLFQTIMKKGYREKLDFWNRQKPGTFGELFECLPESVNFHMWHQSGEASTLPSHESTLSSHEIINYFPHSGEKIINKKFVTGEDQSESSPHPGTNTIYAVNINGIPFFDIMKVVCESLGRPYRGDLSRSSITTKELLDFISNIKIDGRPVVENLMIIDLTCNELDCKMRWGDIPKELYLQYGIGKKIKMRKSKKSMKSKKSKKSRKSKKTRKLKKNK